MEDFKKFLAVFQNAFAKAWQRFQPWFARQPRRTQIIIAAVAFVFVCGTCGTITDALGITGHSTETSAIGNHPTTVATQFPSDVPTSDTSSVTTPTPGKSTPAPKATATHAAVPTATKVTFKYPAINNNPWDYTLTNTGHILYSPNAAVCNYLNCIASFWQNTAGYVDECADGTYSHSGGRTGACSKHGNEKQPVYQP